MQSLLQRLLLGNAGGGGGGNPTLNYNFVDGSAFPSAITFTRASTATFFNSSGVLTSAGNDVPRLDYDPATLAAQGLLIEEQRTNSFLQSQFASGWTFSNASFTGTIIAPDGTNTGQLLNDASAAAAGYLYQGVNVTSGTVYALSCFVKPAGRTNIFFQSFTQAGGVTFTLTGSGSVSAATGVFSSPSITLFGNGWYRCSVLLTASATALNNIGFSTNDNAFTGDAFYLWGAQLEAGAFPTSYIPTTTTALTRSADVASVNTLSPWFNATEGTIYFEGSTTNTGEAPFFVLQNGGITDFIRSSRSFNQSRLLVTVASGSVADLYSGNTTTLGAVLKTAGAYKVNDFANVLNAGTPVVDTSGAVPTVTTLQLGSGGFLGSLGGYIRRITYYPRRLPDATLQQITT